MTFWLDAQLDPELAPWLGASFKVIAKTVREIGLRDATDEELFAAGGRFKDIVIVSKDADFAELVRRKGAPPQVVWLRFPNMSTVKMQSLLAMTFAEAVRLLEVQSALVEITAAGQCMALC